MELVRGIPITEYCDKQKLTTRERLELFIPVCQAIQHAHQKGIIHRDLKPSNVLVTLNDGVPHPMVIDFGIAKATNQKLTEKTLFTNYSQMIGTPAYMAPEQAEMSRLDVDTRSDIYSLGVMLYELLTGGTPFSDETLRTMGWAEMQRVITEQEPQRPSARLSTLTQDQRTHFTKGHREEPGRIRLLLRRELDWIIMKCLEKDRNRRYATANGLALDLRRYLNGEALEAAPPTVSYQLGKLARRNRRTIVTLGVITIILFAASIVSVTWALRAIRAEQVADRERDTADAIWTVFLGKPPQAFLDAEQAVLEGMEAGLEAARAGNVCEDIANAFFAVLHKFGIVKNNRTGYPIGLSYPPDWGERTCSLRPGDVTELKPGMTFHFMTGLWMDDWGFELTESIAITDGPPEILADVPRKLVVKS
jgi:hypothetical protein